MNEKRPILSVCIATFNHAGYLYLTLKSLVEQDIFKNSDDIEIVISDDKSTDFTQEIVRIFSQQFPNKIFYHKNEERLGKSNVKKVLSYARGEVLKLHNDNLIFESGALESMVSGIIANREEKPLIFFSNGQDFYGEDFLCKNLNQFVEHVSYLSLYQSAFSIWREDLYLLDSVGEFCDLDFILTSVLLESSKNRRKVFIFNKYLFEEIFVLQKEIFDTANFYGVKYLELLKKYVEQGFLDGKIYQSEKKYLLREKIIPTKFLYCIENKKWREDKKAFWNVLFKIYALDLYFYKYALKAVKLAIKSTFKYLVKNSNPMIYQEIWRERNPHNSTLISKNSDITRMFAGKNCTGKIDAKFTTNTNELLILGDDVIIDENVKFIFGTKELIIIPDGFTIKSNSIITRSPQE